MNFRQLAAENDDHSITFHAVCAYLHFHSQASAVWRKSKAMNPLRVKIHLLENRPLSRIDQGHPVITWVHNAHAVWQTCEIFYTRLFYDQFPHQTEIIKA